MTAASMVLEDLRVELADSRLVLDIDRLELVSGERLVVYGPNGAGKTTLLRILAGLLPGGPAFPSAYLPQSPYLFRGAVGWNLGLGLNPEQAARARQLADRFGVGGLMEEPARRLSGGERQRIALARVLARPEPWVLLDEPLTALDEADRMGVAAGIVEGLSGRGAVIITHDREAAAVLGDRMIVMVGGRILQHGPVHDVFSLPATEAVAQAVGLGNVLEGTVELVEGPLSAVHVPPVRVWGMGVDHLAAPVRAMFGAEAVTVYPGDESSAGSARNLWRGRVADLRGVGRLIEVVVDVAGVAMVALITPGAQESLQLEPGANVTLAVKATAVRVVPH